VSDTARERAEAVIAEGSTLEVAADIEFTQRGESFVQPSNIRLTDPMKLQLARDVLALLVEREALQSELFEEREVCQKTYHGALEAAKGRIAELEAALRNCQNTDDEYVYKAAGVAPAGVPVAEEEAE
jgi:hypothetical protein